MRKNGANPHAISLNISKEILVGVGGGLVVLMVLVHLGLGAIWLLDVSHLAFCKTQWQKLATDKTALDAINKDSGEIKTRIKTITNLTVKEAVLWAPKFNAISDAVPQGLWIRKMILDKTGLTIEGSVVSRNQSEINNIDLFLSSLKQDDGFMKDFSSLEVNSIQRSKDNAVEVTDFTVMAKLK